MNEATNSQNTSPNNIQSDGNIQSNGRPVDSLVNSLFEVRREENYGRTDPVSYVANKKHLTFR